MGTGGRVAVSCVRPARWVALVVALLVAAPVAGWVIQSPHEHAISAGGSSGSSGLRSARLCAGCLTTHPSGNFSISLTGPSESGKNESVEGGTVLTAEAQLEVANFSTLGVPVVNVFVPTVEAQFDVAGGQLDFNWTSEEVNLSSSGWNGSTVLQTSVTLPETTFVGSVPAILTSSMVALMTQRPWDSLSLNVSWRWGLTPEGMAVSWSDWSVDQALVPDQFLSLDSTSPTVTPPGGPFDVCVGGAIAGRTLSLHIETPNPYYDFDQVNATIPLNVSGPYCWSVPIPTKDPGNNLPWVTPATLIVHIWDYQDFPGPHLTTLLLYVIQVTVVKGFTVTFRESGLPAGTNWSVTVGTQTLSTKVGYIDFDLANGTYSYSVANIAGYSRSIMAGTLSVAGSGVTITEKFVLVKYVVTFKGLSLPSGTNWSVTVGASTEWSTLNFINFHLPNGSYSYTVPNVANYSRSLTGGTFSVAGAGFTIDDRFSLVKYVVTFKEFGLPSGTNWSVTVGTTTLWSTLSYLNFHLANGSYSYAVGKVADFSGSLGTGTFSVAGVGFTIDDRFSSG